MTKPRADFRVPFPQAGEGIFFYFRTSDMVELEAEYGVGEVSSIAEVNILGKRSVSTAEKFLRAGLKREVDGKMVRATPDWCAGIAADEAFERFEGVTIDEIGLAVMDALCLQATGKDYRSIVEEALEEQRKLAEMTKDAIDRASKKDVGDDPDSPFTEPEDSSGS